jgi:hypothetical protein
MSVENAAIANSLGGNGAGIRDQDTGNYDTLTVRNSTFINNQMGILTFNNANDNVILVNNLFMNNGNPNASYFGHAAYIGQANTLIAIGNQVCGTNIGHDIKSRTAINIIENNTLYDGAADPTQPSCNVGSASYALDIPNGGEAVVTGNTMLQGAATENSTIFAYGEEGIKFAVNNITFSNNVMNNTGVSGAIAIYDNPSSPVPVQGNGNSFASSLTEVDPASANQLVGNTGPSGPLSPDGTISLAPNGASLTSNAGTWTWGAATIGQPLCAGCYQIYLNGANSFGNATEMEVAHGGNLYAYNYWGWYIWYYGSWERTSAP